MSSHVRTALPYFGIILGMVALVTGCATPSLPNPAGEAITISFITYGTHLKQHQRLAELFHKEHPTITVEILLIHKLHEEWSDHATISSAAYSQRLAERADVVPINSDNGGVNLYDSIRQNLLSDLQPLLEQDATGLRDLFIPQTLTALGWQNRLYGLPGSFQVPLMMYNSQAFDTAGLPYPAETWTWDDVLTIAQHFSDPTTQQFGLFDTGIQWSLLPFSLITQNSEQLIHTADNLPELNLDDPAITQGLEWYIALQQTHHVMQTDWPDMNSLQEAFCAGMFVLVNKDFREGDFTDCAPSTAAMWPRGELAEPPLITQGFGISAGTSHPQAAWQWLAFLSRQPNLPAFFEWSALQAELSKETVAQDHALSQQAIDIVRATVAAAVPRQLEYDALQPVLQALPQAYEDPHYLRQTIQQLATAPAPRITPEPIAVATPAPPTSPAETTIVFAPPTDRTGTFVDSSAYETLAAAFRKHNPDIQVEVRTFADYTEEKEIAKQADVFLGAEHVLFAHVAEKQYQPLVMDLQPLIDADPSFALADFPHVQFAYPAEATPLVNAGLPIAFDVMGMVYDNERFTTAGAALPTPDWSWNDFSLTAGQLATDKGDTHQYGYVSDSYADLDLELFLAGRGIAPPDKRPGELFATRNKDYAHEPELREALAWWFVLQQHGGMAPFEPSRDDLLERRRGAMWADFLGDVGRSIYPLYIKARNEGWNLGFAPMPQGEHAAAVLRWNIAYISTATKEREASWRWVRFLSEQQMGTFAPARRSLLSADAFRQQVGAEMQQTYLHTLDTYTQGGTAIESGFSSLFLQTVRTEIQAGRSVDAAIEQALQEP